VNGTKQPRIQTYWLQVLQDVSCAKIHNQRIKLTAGWLNGLAGAAAAAGTIALLVAGFYGAATAPISKSLLFAGAGFWLLVAAVLQ
jgi:hypothetical protein